VNRDPWHSIRVRDYESDLSDVRVPLDTVLGPIGVDIVIGEVISVDCARRQVSYSEAGRSVILTYDGLVFALGSELFRPEIVHWRVSCRNPLGWNCTAPQPPATEQSGTSDCHSWIFRI